MLKCCFNLLEDQCTTNGDSAPVNGEGQPRQLDDSMEDIMSKLEAEQPPDYQVRMDVILSQCNYSVIHWNLNGRESSLRIKG